MILAHHRPWLDLFGSVGDITPTFWILHHFLWTHR